VRIDMTEPTEAEVEMIRRVRAVSPAGRITFGAPTRCPVCTSYGYVDRVDSVNGRVHNTCPSCRTAWSINRRALEDAFRPEPIPVRPIGGGVLIEQLAISA